MQPSTLDLPISRTVRNELLRYSVMATKDRYDESRVSEGNLETT
jgi:hypothetical protein